MLFLLLTLACDPTDPLPACIRTTGIVCDCGFPDRDECTEEAIQDDCETNLPWIDVERENCLVHEMFGCSDDFDKDWTAAKKACGMVVIE